MTNALIEERKLTERDLEVLDDLRFAVDDYRSSGLVGWVRPMDCGGSNSSDHSYRLSKLVRMGFASARQRSNYTGRRGSKSYTITDAGRALIKARSL